VNTFRQKREAEEEMEMESEEEEYTQPSTSPNIIQTSPK
jgi:hypothetical protein